MLQESKSFRFTSLHNNGAADVKKPINGGFLEEKSVVIFVELLRVDNKNCDPDTCDDKGVTIEVTHRPLLVDKKNIGDLIYGYNQEDPFSHEPSCIEWPEVKMPRYNVPATNILRSETVLKGFLDVLNEPFLQTVENTLRSAYQALGTTISDEVPNNPFIGFKENHSFLYDGSLSVKQLLYIQYFYDYISDLLLTYDELRKLCNCCLSVCSPNEDLFPRQPYSG